jgi:Xaa-Pro aminopeptidase
MIRELRTVPPRTTPVHGRRVKNASEIDFGRLRSGRLERLQESLRQHGFPVALLSNPASVRYATGTDVMHVWSAENFARYTVVPAEGKPILFEYPGSIHVSERFIDDVRPAFAFGARGPEARTREWAEGMASLLRELQLAGEPVAIDRLDTPQFLSLQAAGVDIVDVSPAVVEAREVKTPEELDLMTINGGIGDAILAELEAAIRPGLREYELYAVLGNALLRLHGEVLFTRLTATGTNTNPWLSEAHDKLVMPGDVVGVDTDANGYEGYVIDISRTFLCGKEATAAQKEAYQAAYEHVIAMVELVKPGMTYGELARLTPPLPEKFKEQRYGLMMHQVGLEDGRNEGPGIPSTLADGIPYVWDEREFKEGMICCFEAYCGEVGGSFGIKLEDQVVIGPEGAELLCTYPYDEKFF